jgi:hypothetical protein
MCDAVHTAYLNPTSFLSRSNSHKPFSLQEMTRDDEIEPRSTCRITSDVLRALRATAELPAPEALLDEAVLLLGRHSAGHLFRVSYGKHGTALAQSVLSHSTSLPTGC